MKKMYSVTTLKYCAAVSIDENKKIIFDGTAPCFIWAAKKGMTFQQFKNYLSGKRDLVSIKEVKRND